VLQREESPLVAYKGSGKGPRSYTYVPNIEKTAQAKEIQKRANPAEQTGNCTKIPAPNLGVIKGEGSKPLDTLKGGLDYYTNQETWVGSTEKADNSPEAKTATGNRTTETTAQQPTLGHVLNENLSQLGSNQDKTDILVHGPRGQGPRTLLIVHQDLQEDL
jgi:hypothetical protein